MCLKLFDAAMNGGDVHVFVAASDFAYAAIEAEDWVRRQGNLEGTNQRAFELETISRVRRCYAVVIESQVRDGG